MDDILTAVKLALRISHSKLDTEITDTINAAKDEMKRVGIAETAIIDTNPLIRDAIKIYCRAIYTTDNNTSIRLNEAWVYRLDCLRKSTDFKAVEV